MKQMSENRIQRMIIDWETEGRRSRGRIPVRWKDVEVGEGYG